MTTNNDVMTDEQRKSLILKYFKALDGGGTAVDGTALFDLFADDAQAYFPKWGIADGKPAIIEMYSAVGQILRSIKHHYDSFNWVFSGSDLVVCEGSSHGEHVDGAWTAGAPAWGAGRFCDVFEIREFRIQRLFIYLDPDYANLDHARYPWLAGRI